MLDSHFDHCSIRKKNANYKKFIVSNAKNKCRTCTLHFGCEHFKDGFEIVG